MATLQCNVVSAKETIYSGEISMLIATGVEGEVGILPGHIPFITLLKPCLLYTSPSPRDS